MRLLRTTVTLVAPLSSLLMLTGCAGGTPGVEGGSAPEASAAEVVEEVEEPTPTPTPTPTPSAEPDAKAGASCLQGAWTTDVAALREWRTLTMDPSVFPPEFENPQIEMSGDSTITFDASTMTTDYVEFDTTILFQFQGQQLGLTSTLNGRVVGPFTATDTELTVTPDVDITGLTFTNEATIDGSPFDAGDLSEFPSAEVPLGGVSPYTCDATTLTLTPPADVGFTMVLTRR